MEDRHQGVGSNVIGEIKKFAKDHKLVITLSREPERGHKKNLERFYKNLGFVDNKGRNKDYQMLHSSEALCIINHISMRGLY